MEARNRAKGDLLYGVMTSFPDFYKLPGGAGEPVGT
jgi:hypothetical protein